jgi:hypothetical protein
MSTRTHAALDPQIVALLQGIADEKERAELWQSVLDWAGGFESRTGQPPALADLYREAPVLGLIEAENDAPDE